MKKALATVGVAASMVLAAMPVAGVFATIEGDNAWEDEISVTVNPTCSIERGNKGANDTAHVDGTGSNSWTAAWTTGGDASADGVDTFKDTTSGSIVAGTVYDFGSSNFTVKCNKISGWQVSATATSLTSSTSGNNSTIGVGTPSATAAAWSFTPTSNESTYSITAGAANASVVATGVGTNGNAATGNTGVSFNVAYSVSVAYDIPADTYAGTITYELAEL